MRAYLFGLHWHPMIIYILEKMLLNKGLSQYCVMSILLMKICWLALWIPMVVVWFLLVPICIIFKNILTEL